MKKIILIGGKGILGKYYAKKLSLKNKVFVADIGLKNKKQSKNRQDNYLDILDENIVKQYFREIKRKFGEIDILINNAAFTTEMALKDFNIKNKDYFSTKIWDQTINTNLKGSFLACKYLKVKNVYIPSKTYLSVPQSIMQAGGEVIFDISQNEWSGAYKLNPYPIWDSAKRLTSGMYIKNSFMCLSFHIKKTLKIGKGGMVLTDDKNFVDWFRKARYEGRGWQTYYKDDNINEFIHLADIVISEVSSVLAEACLLDKPVIQLILNKFP